MDWVEKAKKVYQERGYLVIARFTPCKIGHIITVVDLQDKFTFELPQPFRVIAETDLADYAAQHEVAEEELSGVVDRHYFYRMMTD